MTEKANAMPRESQPHHFEENQEPPATPRPEHLPAGQAWPTIAQESEQTVIQPTQETDQPAARKLSRRDFLKTAALATGSALAAHALAPLAQPAEVLAAPAQPTEITPETAPKTPESEAQPIGTFEMMGKPYRVFPASINQDGRHEIPEADDVVSLWEHIPGKLIIYADWFGPGRQTLPYQMLQNHNVWGENRPTNIKLNVTTSNGETINLDKEFRFSDLMQVYGEKGDKPQVDTYENGKKHLAYFSYTKWPIFGYSPQEPVIVTPQSLSNHYIFRTPKDSVFIMTCYNGKTRYIGEWEVDTDGVILPGKERQPTRAGMWYPDQYLITTFS
jgi:hypothetical protein